MVVSTEPKVKGSVNVLTSSHTLSEVTLITFFFLWLDGSVQLHGAGGTTYAQRNNGSRRSPDH